MENNKLFPDVDAAKKARVDYLMAKVAEVRPLIDEQLMKAGSVKIAFSRIGTTGIDQQGFITIICDGWVNAVTIVEQWAKELGYTTSHSFGSVTSFLRIEIPFQKH